MKKNNEKGFMLIETLLVSLFVGGTLIYLYVQFSNLNRSYNDSFSYNTVGSLYSLVDVKDFLYVNFPSVEAEIYTNTYSTNICAIIPDSEYCNKLLIAENIKTLLVAYNDLSNSNIPTNLDEDFKDFINKINPAGEEEFRLVAQFNDNTYATLRF